MYRVILERHVFWARLICSLWSLWISTIKEKESIAGALSEMPTTYRIDVPL